jgi:hypothetical protein
VRSKCPLEVAGHAGQRSLGALARGRLHDQSWQLGGGRQLCGHKPRASMQDKNRRRSTALASLVVCTRSPNVWASIS